MFVSNKQLQGYPTPVIWEWDPKPLLLESLSSGSDLPVAAAAYNWILGMPPPEYLFTRSISPTTSGGTTAVPGPMSLESFSTKTIPPTATWLSWVWGSNQTESFAGLSNQPAATWLQIWIFAANETEALATVPDNPTATNGP